MTNHSINRRTFLKTTGASLVASYGLAQDAATEANQPNIVYVFSDEHRYQSMSFTEMAAMKTPAMARMAKEGFTFHRCISNYPVCSPHRGILIQDLTRTMTERYP